MHVCFYIDHVCIHLWAVPGESFIYVFHLFFAEFDTFKNTFKKSRVYVHLFSWPVLVKPLFVIGFGKKKK